MTTTTDTRPRPILSAGERIAATKRLLRDHGVRTLGNGSYRNDRRQPLGGPRGVYVTGSGTGAQIHSYHPHEAIRLEQLGAASAALREEGWEVSVQFTRTEPTEDRPVGSIEVFLFAFPTRPGYWER